MGNSILDIGVTGLLTAQNQLQTTSHNISNADTPGFKRQQVVLSTNIPQSSGTGFVGRGVQSTTVQRIYNQFLVSQSLQVQTQSQSLDNYYAQIKQLDNMFAEATSGLSPTLQNFFSAIQDVTIHPSVIPSRQAMLSNAEALVARFQSMDQRMSQIREGINTQISSSIAEINSLADQVAELNHQILLAEGAAAGQPANDMLDQRDELINHLSKLINTDTVRQSDGTVNVYVGNGQALVVGTQALSLQATTSPDNPDNVVVGLMSGGNTIQLPENQITGGALGGILSFRSVTLDSAQNALGRIAITLAQTFNEQHQLGLDLNGNMGEEFFTVSPPKVTSALTNDAASNITVGISDFGVLTTSNYQFSYDGTNYTLTRLSDNSSISTLIVPSGATPLTLDGVSVTGATILSNERFLIQPAINGAKNIAVNITDATKIAAAGPNRTGAALSNTGTGTISAGTVNPLPLDPNLQQPLTITFHAPYDGQYDMTGIGTGLPATNQVYTAGADISFNGYTFQINGNPAAGDIFTVTPNNNGSADNRNALLLGVLQTTSILENGSATYQSAYGQLVSQIGNKTRELEVTSKAQANLLAQTEKSIQSVSGVNLDEEAANLLRFQHAFQASSKVIEISNTLFDSILRIG
ncbi:flagellar hook-associated protein FlgK [Nitrosomonas sp. Nm166]|uniref:flagellar hook-associated protein FlgK n=1 Tax=Nitrosomonas sp. Nm166 TaxID=1881054 RepID=UPI0008E1074B|nr:flagellar hook-associated protein FlgK [Nitrosomonas sp. Nm166]SFE26576.1 flagellar hook-associated protein 1 FlgK [Nitrosomonas sp. Nm166]